MPPHLNVPCVYDGVPANELFSLCPHCWGRLPGELHDRVNSTREQHGVDTDRFKVAVEGCAKFLSWLDEQAVK